MHNLPPMIPPPVARKEETPSPARSWRRTYLLAVALAALVVLLLWLLTAAFNLERIGA